MGTGSLTESGDSTSSPFSRRSAPSVGVPRMAMVGKALEGEGLREPDAAHWGRRLPTHLDVSHQRARAEGTVLRLVLAVCAGAVCSAQCPPRSALAPFHNTPAPSLQQCLCNAGYSGPDGGECVPCAPGMFKARAGNATCEPCPPGSAQPLGGASSCSECPAQTFASASKLECLSCPDGSFPPSADTPSCVCTAGYGGPSGGPCSPCTSGTYKREAGSGACTACPPGSFTSQSNASTFCSVCPPGTYLAGVPDAVTCRACPSRGSNSSAPNAWSNCTDKALFLSPQDDWKARIQEAPHGATVFLFPGVYVGECNVRVQRNITLRGVSGKAETVLDCQQRNRHLHVTGASVTIEGLTLTNGHADNEGGGCVLADGKASVAISGSSLADCSTLSHGGLLKLGHSSALLLSDETELRNGSAGGHGGGVSLEEGSLMTALRNVLIVGNEAGGKGAGIFSGSSSVVDLKEGVEIRGCVAGVFGGGLLVEASSTLRAAGNVLI
eukprot:3326620-Rhodomonas_salina.1